MANCGYKIGIKTYHLNISAGGEVVQNSGIGVQNGAKKVQNYGTQVSTSKSVNGNCSNSTVEETFLRTLSR